MPGSGNTPWLKLDVEDVGRFLWSLKWTGKPAFNFTPGLVDEVRDAIWAPGGVGGGTIGGLAVCVGGRWFALLEFDDMTKVLTEKITVARQDKSEAKLERASTPLLFRDDV